MRRASASRRGRYNEIVDPREHAEPYGAKLAVKITKTVQWMVATTRDATDSRHMTARNSASSPSAQQRVLSIGHCGWNVEPW